MIRYIELDGTILEYELLRKDVKNINLRIRTDGTVCVSAHPRISVKEIDAFIRNNQAFVLRSLTRFSGSEKDSLAQEAVCFSEGGRFPILGKERVLRVTLGKRDFACLEGDTIRVTVVELEEEHVQTAIRLMLEDFSKRILPEICQKELVRFDAYRISMPVLHYRRMVSRWGSCCPATHEITFNKLLICAPPSSVEYVVVHELAHFLISNHSPAFHRLMTELMPDWKARKKQLEPYGKLLRKL